VIHTRQTAETVNVRVARLREVIAERRLKLVVVFDR
jgi:hypothetical protein